MGAAARIPVPNGDVDVECRHDLRLIAVLHEDRTGRGVAQLGDASQHDVEHDPHVARVLADETQHLTCRCLQRQGVGHLAPLLGCGDGIAGLNGERLQQLNIIIGERLDDVLEHA